MSINFISQTFVKGDTFIDEPLRIGISKPDGRELSTTEILQQAVMFALGTNDAKKADEFIKQYGLQPPAKVLAKDVSGQKIYQLPVNSEFYSNIKEFKPQADKSKTNGTSNINANAPVNNTRENNLQTELNAQKIRLKTFAPIEVPAKFRAAYHNYLRANNRQDSYENRHNFIKALKNNPQTLAKYQPLFTKDAQFDALRKKQAEMEKQTAARVQAVNEGYQLRTGKTAPKSKFSVAMEKEYQIARLVYQATDSQEFRQAFIDGKLGNAGKIFNARYAEDIEKSLGKSNPLLYGYYRSETANPNISPDQIDFNKLNLEEQKMLASIEVESSENGGKNQFATGTLGNAEALKRGYDGNAGKYTYNTAGLKDLADPRRETYRRVLVSAGYSDTEAKAFLDAIEKEKGEVSYIWTGKSDYDTNKDGKVQAGEEAAFAKDEKNLIGIFTLSSEDREKVSVTGALARGDKQAAFDILANNYRLRQEREFEKNKSGSLLKDGFEALALHRRMNEDIDKLSNNIFNGNEDFRISDNPFQGAANKTADYIEKETKGWIETVPFLKNLSEENKQRIIDLRVGTMSGTVQLFAMVNGVTSFLPELIEDGLIYSLKQTGLDTSGYEAGVKQLRETRANFYQAFTKLNTKSLQLRENVYQTKQDLNIRTSVFDLPSGARSVGEMIPQIVPQLVVGAVTGPMGLLSQIAINAAVGAAMEGGQTYALTNNREKAVADAAFGAINGGLIPAGNKLGLVEDISLQIGWTAIQGKMRGLNDNQIVDQMIKQAGGAIAFRTGTKLNIELAKIVGKTELSINEAKRIFGSEVFKSLREGSLKYAENLQAIAKDIGAKIKTEGGKLIVEVPKRIENAGKVAFENYGKNNKVMTSGRVETVNQALKQNHLEMKTELIPTVLIKLAAKGAYNAEGTLRAFGDFATEVRKSPIKFSEAEMAAAYRVETGTQNLKIDETALASEAMRRRAPNGMPENLLKIRESLTDGVAREAFDVKYKQMNGGKGFEARIEGMQKRGDLSAELATQYRKDIALQIESVIRENNFPIIKKQLLTDKGFLRGADIQEALTKPTAKSQRVALRSALSVEITNRILAAPYPTAQGHQAHIEVKVFTDTGFTSKTDWQKANPGKSAEGYYQIGSKFMYGATDIDILILKLNANGKSDIVHTEQIKAGENDNHERASLQRDKMLNALNNSANVDVVLQKSDGTILTNINYDSIKKSKNVTRGLPVKGAFDEKLNLDYKQLNKIAEEIENLRKRGGI